MKGEFKGDASQGAIYGLGVVGAGIYFVSKATGFWMGAFGIVKALVWPAIMVYEGLVRMGL